MRVSACALAVVWAVAATGCSLVAPYAPSLPQPPRSFYVPIAEALTSPSLTEAMRVAPRRLSPFQLSEACRTPRRIGRLEAPSRELELRVGERVALSSLRVVAISDANVIVPGVPVVIEAEERNPPIVQLRSDDPDLDTGWLRSIGSGEFRMRIRTICGSTNAELTITGTVS